MAMGRIVKLFVGNFMAGNVSGSGSVEKPLDALDLSDLDIDFEVSRSIEWYDNEATITIYNPKPETLNSVMNEGNSVILQAGYRDQDNVKNVFVGQIAVAEPRRAGKDVELVLTCVQARGAFYQLARLNCSVSFSKGKKIRECIKHLCDYAGIVLRAGKKEFLDRPIEWPFRYTGTFTDVIRAFSENIIFPMAKVKLYLDNNELIVFGIDNTIELEDVFLNHDTGLLECSVVRDESLNKVNFGDDPAYYMFSGTDEKVKPKDRPSKEIDRKKKIKCRSLMNPAIVPNVFVQVDSSDNSEYDSAIAVKGRYVVTECRYSGGNTGNDFTVSFDAQEAPAG